MKARDGSNRLGPWVEYVAEGGAIRIYKNSAVVPHANAVPVAKKGLRALTPEEESVRLDLLEAIRELN